MPQNQVSLKEENLLIWKPVVYLPKKKKFADWPTNEILMIFQTGVLFWDPWLKLGALRAHGPTISPLKSALFVLRSFNFELSIMKECPLEVWCLPKFDASYYGPDSMIIHAFKLRQEIKKISVLKCIVFMLNQETFSQPDQNFFWQKCVSLWPQSTQSISYTWWIIHSLISLLKITKYIW